jgi:hypothetical protein
MGKEQLKSSRTLVPDTARREAVFEAARILRGLQADLTLRTISTRAARIVDVPASALQKFIVEKITLEEKILLGLRLKNNLLPPP